MYIIHKDSKCSSSTNKSRREGRCSHTAEKQGAAVGFGVILALHADAQSAVALALKASHTTW